MGKKHITINREEQLKIDAAVVAGEIFQMTNIIEVDPEHRFDLCDTCTKLIGCPIYDFKNNICECSNYGKPN